jgi:hypothetical protein
MKIYSSVQSSTDHALPTIKQRFKSVCSSDYVSTTIQSEHKGNRRYNSIGSLKVMQTDTKEYL